MNPNWISLPPPKKIGGSDSGSLGRAGGRKNSCLLPCLLLPFTWVTNSHVLERSNRAGQDLPKWQKRMIKFFQFCNTDRPAIYAQFWRNFFSRPTNSDFAQDFVTFGWISWRPRLVWQRFSLLFSELQKRVQCIEEGDGSALASAPSSPQVFKIFICFFSFNLRTGKRLCLKRS